MTPLVRLRLAAVLGFLAVAFGAFGAHGLESRLDAQHLQTFETGVRYQMYHALALLGTAFLATDEKRSKAVGIAAWSFVVGCLFFSGSLYALALGGPKWLGMVAPIGGLAFMIGWAALVMASPIASRRPIE